MQPSDLSDGAVRLWAGFFLNGKSTLRFGGDGAEYQITPEARKALDELIAVGAVVAVEPDCEWPNREHYGAGEVNLHPVLMQRVEGFDAFEWLRGDDQPVFRRVPEGSEVVLPWRG